MHKKLLNLIEVVQKSKNIDNLSLKEHQFELAQKVIQNLEATLRTFY